MVNESRKVEPTTWRSTIIEVIHPEEEPILRTSRRSDLSKALDGLLERMQSVDQSELVDHQDGADLTMIVHGLSLEMPLLMVAMAHIVFEYGAADNGQAGDHGARRRRRSMVLDGE